MSDPLVEAIGTAAERLLERMRKGAQRVVLAGGPRTGKTTLAETIGALWGGTIFHTDDLIATHDWSAASEECARWMYANGGPWVIEGVAAVRALRKWMDTHPGRPCELVIWMGSPVVHLTTGQQTMAKGCRTIWDGKGAADGVRDRLLDRGVMVEED